MDNKLIKQSVEALEKSKLIAQDEVRRLDRAIDSIRDLCPHETHPTGHGHNYTVYECSICGREEHW